ncbi:MAG: hypothetical protein HYT67_00215 [Candidatus Yanofskybacteria bacterium]|nr:hypothetical protein [Candidatus Yanofskybacteria bacterium]
MTRTKALLTLAVILFASSLFAIGCSTKSADANTVLAPHRTSVYFVVDRPDGFVAYVPEGSVRVGIKIQPNVTEPYVEVPKQKKDAYQMGEGEFVAWGFGGTLYVKDVEQFRGLLLAKSERE